MNNNKDMSMQNRIKNYFTESIQTQIVMAESLSATIEQVVNIVTHALLNGNKILSCGNGLSSANVQNFTSCLLNGIAIERPAIPAIALVTDNAPFNASATSHQALDIYAKQIQALGQKGDILVVLSCNGNSQTIIRAVQEAVIKDMTIIAVTGCDGGEVVGLLGQQDLEIRIPSYNQITINEMHLMILNCLCQLIEDALFIHREA